MNSFVNKRVTGVLLLSLLTIVGIASLIWFLNEEYSKALVRQGDQLRMASYDEYAIGSSHSAIMALRTEVDYLTKHKDRIGRYRNCGMMLKNAHGRLAYLLLHSGDVEGASSHVCDAYRYHRGLVSEGVAPEVGVESFVDYFLDIMKQLDERTGAAWKVGTMLNSNVVEELKRKAPLDMHL